MTLLLALGAWLIFTAAVVAFLVLFHGRRMNHCIVAGCRGPRAKGYVVCGTCLGEILAAEDIPSAVDGKLRPHPRLTLI